MEILFRPHHFLCALGFEGKGYSPKFIRNFMRIVSHLRGKSGDDAIIEVTEHTDSVCTPCPNRRDTLCLSQEKIETLDKNHAAILGLHACDKISWHDAKVRLAQNMTLDKFHAACQLCEWKKLGVCEKALINLHKTHS